MAVSNSDIPTGSWTVYRVPSWDGSAIAGLTGCNTNTPVRGRGFFFLKNVLFSPPTPHPTHPHKKKLLLSPSLPFSLSLLPLLLLQKKCFPDYPSLGYNENSVAITVNQFAVSGNNYFFRGAMIISIGSAGLLSGNPFVWRAKLPVPSMKVSLLSLNALTPTTGNKVWLIATNGASQLYLTTLSDTDNLASSTAPTTISQIIPTTISVANAGASPLLSNGVTAFDTVDYRVMSFSVSGTR